VLGCKHEQPESDAPDGLAAGATRITIEAAPEHLQGRVALAAGARVYSRPAFTSPSWAIALPDPPLSSGDGPPRAKAFRTVGIVRANDGSIGGSGDFIAITNDLEGEDENAPIGCGSHFTDLEHLRMLLYVPVIHLAQVTTRALEIEALSTRTRPDRLRLGAGTRVGPVQSLAGLPKIAEGSSWRWIDADGIRTLAPIPNDAVGVAWDPGRVPEFADAGDAMFRDAEGSTMWLRDDGGETVELTIRNACAEQRQRIDDPDEVANLRALALDAFYDQRPRTEPEPVVEADADYRIPAGTPLRWSDGDLAGETLADWSVAIGVGQTWDARLCFPLPLGAELAPVDATALACVDPDALELLAAGVGFGVSDELSVGGSIELGPVVELDGGGWDPQSLRAMLNSHHESVGECLQPLLLASEGLTGARWDLRLTVTALGRVDQVEVVARGKTFDAVDDCLRAEAYTWLLPEGPAGRIEVPVTVGEWTPEMEAASEPEPEPEPEPKKGKGKPSKQKDEPERGKVIIIRDDDEPPGE
jgi:hypothetical protein